MPTYADVKAVAQALRGTFGGLLAGFDLSELVLGLSYLSKLEAHERERACCQPLPGTLVRSDDETVHALHERVHLAAIAYLSSSEEIASQLAQMHRPYELRRCETAGSFREPSFFIAASRDSSELAVVVRGTKNWYDALTDGLVEQTEFLPGHFAHAGIVSAAQHVVMQTEGEVQRALFTDGMRVTFLGHSLGAGASALAALIWKKHKLFKCTRADQIQAFCFAPPPVVDEATAREGESLGIISCAVNDDFVPRASEANIRELRERLRARASDWQTAAKDDIMQTSAGRVFFNMCNALDNVASSERGQRLSSGFQHAKHSMHRFITGNKQQEDAPEEIELKALSRKTATREAVAAYEEQHTEGKRDSGTRHDHERAQKEETRLQSADIPLHVLGTLYLFRTQPDGSVECWHSCAGEHVEPFHMLGRIELSPTLVTDHLTATISEALHRQRNGAPRADHEGFLLKQQGGKRRMAGIAGWMEQYFRLLPGGGNLIPNVPVIAYSDHPRSLVHRNELLLDCYLPERENVPGRSEFVFKLKPLASQLEEVRLEAHSQSEMEGWMEALGKACGGSNDTDASWVASATAAAARSDSVDEEEDGTDQIVG